MAEETVKKRGRPRKETVVENNSQSSPIEKVNEFNSYADSFLYNSIFSCGVYDYFSKDEIDSVLRSPITNYETAIKLSEFAYGKKWYYQ